MMSKAGGKLDNNFWDNLNMIIAERDHDLIGVAEVENVGDKYLELIYGLPFKEL